MKLGYDLKIEQTQKLVMTPELIQAIQILQFNTQELDAYVQEQLLANPVLETGKPADDQENEEDKEREDEQRDLQAAAQGDEQETGSVADWEAYIKDRGYDDISYRQWEYVKKDRVEAFEQYASADVTLQEHLLAQLRFASLRKGCKEIGGYIIESLDENGYLTLTPAEIAERLGISEVAVAEALEAVRSFDPAGVGAKNLADCLLIQLERFGTPDALTAQVIGRYLEEIAANRLGFIAKELGTTAAEIQRIADLIRGLEPKPGRSFASQTETRYVIPDVLVEKIGGAYAVAVNESSAPRLAISPYYEKLMAESAHDAELAKYLSGRFSAAVWLIKAIEQRKQTMHNVVSAVVKYQKPFFDSGTKHLKTLTLKQIAEEVGVHESTVSRAINGKYMQTPRGVFEIKYFFTSGVAGTGGEGISSCSIKAVLRELLGEENPKSPHSDEELAVLLRRSGISISRRTVAKYREEMQIASSSKRKRY